MASADTLDYAATPERVFAMLSDQAFQEHKAAATGALKGLFIVGSNPRVTYPGGELARRALERLEFLVVQDVFLTDTAASADVVIRTTSRWAGATP